MCGMTQRRKLFRRRYYRKSADVKISSINHVTALIFTVVGAYLRVSHLLKVNSRGLEVERSSM
jgi:hypothetical protein